MTRLHALLFCSLLAPACDSSSDASTPAKTDAKSETKTDGKVAAKTDAKAGDGKAEAKADAPAAKPAAGTPKVGEGPVVPAKSLALHEMPPLAGIPEGAIWTSVEAEKDGHKWANLYVYGKGDEKQGYISLRIIDCNSPTLKKYEAKPQDSGDFQHCFLTPAADAPKAGKWPRLDKTGDAQVVLKVDHLVVISGTWDEKKVGLADIAAYLGTVDFETLLAEAK